MRKVNIFIISLILFLSFNNVIQADCNDDELNEWATKINAKFTINEETEDAYQYAYFLGIDDFRDDIKIEVIDGTGNKAKAETFERLNNLYAVGCYTNFEEETYTINVYGNEKSKCSNELLKSIKYTVPRLNRMRHDRLCETYPDHELCQAFTNKTENMTEDEVHKELEKYDKEITGNEIESKSKIMEILTYLAYILVPFIVISVVYIVRVKKFKKEEKER